MQLGTPIDQQPPPGSFASSMSPDSPTAAARMQAVADHEQQQQRLRSRSGDVAVDDADAYSGDSGSPSSTFSSGAAANIAVNHKNRTIPLWVVAALWVLLIANVAFVFGYLIHRPINSPQGPVPKWQREKQQQQTKNASALVGDDEVPPAPPLIDPLWLYAALPFLFLPTIVVFSYVNWLGWQFFKHN